MVLDDSQAL